MLDITHSYVTDGASANDQSSMQQAFSESGHLWRQEMDRQYRRRTWGMGDDAAKSIADNVRQRRADG